MQSIIGWHETQVIGASNMFVAAVGVDAVVVDVHLRIFGVVDYLRWLRCVAAATASGYPSRPLPQARRCTC